MGQKYCVEVNSREEFDGTHRTPFENTLNVFINEANASNWSHFAIAKWPELLVSFPQAEMAFCLTPYWKLN